MFGGGKEMLGDGIKIRRHGPRGGKNIRGGFKITRGEKKENPHLMDEVVHLWTRLQIYVFFLRKV